MESISWLMPLADVCQNSSTEYGGFSHLLKIWLCKLAVSCLVCSDVYFGLAVGQECAYLLLPYGRPSKDSPLAGPYQYSVHEGQVTGK